MSRADLNMQKEKEFHLTQQLIGMRIRIQAGREKPIDRILKNILLLDVVHSLFPFIFIGYQQTCQSIRYYCT